MSLTLSHLTAYPKKRRKRIGRGDASGHGTYATRGQKGQKARSGGRKRLKRRGLKQFLQQIPKHKGFKSFAVQSAVVNLRELQRKFEANTLVNRESLLQAGLIKKNERLIKILGSGKLTKKLTVQAHGFSKSARKAIIKAGGTVQVMKHKAFQIKTKTKNEK